MRCCLARSLFVLFVNAALACCPSGAVYGEPAVFTQQATVEPTRVVDGTVNDGVARTSPSKASERTTANFAKGPTANWIWGGPAKGDDRYQFEKPFTTQAQSAQLIASCDNRMTIFLNGKRVASSGSWESPVKVDVSKFLQRGENRLRVDGANEGGAAGLALKLVLAEEATSKTPTYVVTDESWKARRGQDGPEQPVVVIGKMGSGPSGAVFQGGGRRPGLLADIPRDVFNVLPGFQVELLYTAPKATQGSWVSMTFDHKGRIIASDQGDKGLFRITPPEPGGRTKVERLDIKITGAQGMLYAFDSLYLSVNGGPGSGFYRATDTNGDDQFDKLELLKRFRGGGEHGPHAVRLGPDGKSLYVIAGNHTDPPENFAASRPPKNWSEDHLLPRQWDARGHAAGKLAPGGWIAKTDPQGETWEMFSIGYRNPYDMDFNLEGELFAYDADMEWDLGAPWYRPTRVVHATSGSEFGWRSGTGKWPTYYADSLPPVVDIGPGSPVGVTFGYGARFPVRHQRALYLLDWTFGTIYAIHLTPAGASYRGVKEEFLSRSPLPLTDAAVGPDGAMYFTVGGRNTQSALYRVTYRGDASTAPAVREDDRFAPLRAVRRELETMHRRSEHGAAAVDKIWPHLAHDDRHIRFAARTALEHQDVALWRERAVRRQDPQGLITAAIALARQGAAADGPRLTAALNQLDFAQLNKQQQLDLLRAYALNFVRLGDPSAASRAALAKRLDGFYPASGDELNRELCRMLVYLNSPTVVSKTIALMKQPAETGDAEIPELLARNAGYGGTIAQMLANKPEIQKLHYALVLRNMRFGWTLDERKDYLAWIDQAKQRSGGASYQGFLDNIRKESLANASASERAALASLAVPPPINESELPQPKGPGRKWTVDDVVKLAEAGLKDRSFENGKRTYAAARCVSCHRFDGAGGGTGHDLTNLAGRFSLRDLAESIVEPSKVVSDQYRAEVIVAGGKILTGRVVSDDAKTLEVLIDPVDATKTVTVNKDDIEQRKPSPTSLMPTELLERLNQEELLDLLAYLMSRGNPQDLVFQQSPTSE